MSNHKFSSVDYSELIDALRAKGYEPHSFADAKPASRHLIVRHDIDFSLDAACVMAEQESRLGFSSIYFILLRTEFYNPLSARGLAALKRILEFGHEIGLHFDAGLYSGDAQAIDDAVREECALLESMLEKPVIAMSFHRPAPNRIGAADRLGGRLNVYGPRFVTEMGYCSDSRGGWHHGHPLDHPAVREGRALQLLVHPFWWQEPAMEPQARLNRFLDERGEFLDRELARHCTVHHVGNR